MVFRKKVTVIFYYFFSFYSFFDVFFRKETLEDGIKKGLRGTEREKCLASRLTAIFGMCTDDGEGFYNSLKDDLQNAISNSIGSSKYAAAEIIKAWATLAFIAGDEHDNLEFISKCVEWGKIESCSSECKKAIVSAIGFCTSALPGNTVVEKIIPEYVFLKIMIIFYKNNF